MNNSKNISAFTVILFLLLFIILSCSSQSVQTPNEDEVLKKISFDLEMLNDEGLFGPREGLVALDYKFCIPLNDKTKNEVVEIDTTINFHRGTGINDGCSVNEYLCIGNTHQKDFKTVLIKLASLEYVESIDQMFWEK